MSTIKKIAAVAIIALVAPGAHAGLIQISGGTYYKIPASNDVLPVGWGGYYHAPTISTTEEVWLTFQYMGSEAGNRSEFETGGEDIDNHGDYDTIDVLVNGVLDFTFTDESSCGFLCTIFGGSDAYINNGGSFGGRNGEHIDYWASYADDSHNHIWLAFNDVGGDADYDDLVVGAWSAKHQKVSEPGTLALFTLGLLAIGVARRRRA